MTLGRFASLLTQGARLVRDANAVKRHRVIQRLENKAIGRLAGRLLRGLWR